MRFGSFALGICFYLFSQFVYSEDFYRIREPKRSKTPCGIYLASIAHDTNGELIFEVNPHQVDYENLHAQIQKIRDQLKPRLSYIHSKNGRSFKNAGDLKQALIDGVAKPIVDYPLLAMVGLPLIGSEAKEFKKRLGEILEREGLKDIAILLINRPVAKHISQSSGIAKAALLPLRTSHYFLQRIIYNFPDVFGQDYQKPVQAEIDSKNGKLLTANTFQQGILFGQAAVDPSLSFAAVTAGGLVNYGNSHYTGKYRKVISNWFNRSYSEPERLTKNFMLTGFFVAEIYWLKHLMEPVFQMVFDAPSGLKPLGMYLPIDFLHISEFAAWKSMFIAKWAAAVFGVGWRYFYYQAIHSFEKRLESEGRIDDARRTAGRFEWFGTILGTPAFLYATLAPKDAGLAVNVLGQHIMQLNAGHAMMAAVGGLFALYHYGVFKMDPWVDRFDRIHHAVKTGAGKAAKGIGGVWNLCFGRFCPKPSEVEEAVDRVEKMTRGAFEKGYELENIQQEDRPMWDLEGMIELDPLLKQMLEEDLEFRNFLQSDEEIADLISRIKN